MNTRVIIYWNDDRLKRLKVRFRQAYYNFFTFIVKLGRVSYDSVMPSTRKDFNGFP